MDRKIVSSIALVGSLALVVVLGTAVAGASTGRRSFVSEHGPA